MVIAEQLRALLRVINHPLNKKNRLHAIGKILWWKTNQRFFRLPALVEINNKLKCICYPTSSYGGLIMYSKLPEYPEMMLMKKILKPNSAFLDIGANIGAFTILAASIITKGKIYSFEPIPSVLEILHQNVRINNLEGRVKVVEKVVSDKNGREKFAIDSISEYSHISTNLEGVSIPAVRLDDFCESEKVSHIDMIKIDVEGAALKVLKGLEGYLSKGKIGVLIVELSTDSSLYGLTSQDVINYLRQFDYKTFLLDDKLHLKEIKKISNNNTYNIVAFRKNL